MVGRLPPLLEDLDRPARELGDLPQDVSEEASIDLAGARARHEDAVGLEDVEGRAVEAEVALEGVLQVPRMAGELGCSYERREWGDRAGGDAGRGIASAQASRCR